MAINSNKTILQVIVTKKTCELIRKYSEFFGISLSQFCSVAIVEKCLSLLNMEVKKCEEEE